MVKNEDFFDTELAQTIFTSKYAKTINGKKENIGQAIERLAKAENKYDPNSKKKKEMIDKTIEYISNKYFTPAGGQWRAAGSDSNKISNVNCTTSFPPEDNLESISDSVYWWSKFAAYGQGNGIDLSKLRPAGRPLRNTAKTATGAVSFMHLYDAALSVIAQDGRRGASLISIHDTYPDFEAFCTVKDGKKNNIETANISIQVSDEFMQAVLDNKNWALRWESQEHPEDSVYIEKKARELFDLLVTQAWQTGDPGLQFKTRMHEYSISDLYGEPYVVTSSNACCLTGDTLVALADGRSPIPIKDVIKAYKSNPNLRWQVHSWDKKSDRPVVAHIVRAFEIGIKPVYKVNFDDGSSIKCTAEHKFYTTDLQMKLAKDLISGDSLLSGNIEAVKSKTCSWECSYVYRAQKRKESNISYNHKVATIEYIGEQEVFDIEVDHPDHIVSYSLSEYVSGKNYKSWSILYTSNSEQILDPHNTCVLSSICLAYAPTEMGQFLKWLEDLTYFGIRYLDNVILNELNEERSPSPHQLEKMKKMTRVGLGFTGWADWLIRQQVPYDSPEAMALAQQVYSSFRKFSLQASNELGAERGTYEEFDPKVVLKSKHYQNLLEEGLIEKEDISHLRHVACLSYAPTGSISILLGAGGSGIEPIFSRYYVRRERASNDGQWKEWFIYNDAVIRFLKDNHHAVTRENVEKYCSEDYWVTAHNVDNFKKVDFLNIVQRYCDSSISTTFNLPVDASKEDIADIYVAAWKAELKGATVYREGSKTGVLITEDNYDQAVEDGRKPYMIQRHLAPPRPKELPCDIYHMTSEKKQWLVLVGKLGDEPYEVFAGLEDKINIPKKYKEGKILKKSKRKYALHIPIEEDDDLIFNDILSLFENTEYNVLTRMVSMSLRHGTPIQFVCDQLAKEKQDFTAFNKAIARVLKKYIRDGEKVGNGDVCPTCQNSDLVFQGGCVTCLKCGFSKCS